MIVWDGVDQRGALFVLIAGPSLQSAGFTIEGEHLLRYSEVKSNEINNYLRGATAVELHQQNKCGYKLYLIEFLICDNGALVVWSA